MDLFGREPHFVRDDGKASPDVRALIDENSAISLDQMARLLSRPVLYGDYLPDTPWSNIRRARCELQYLPTPKQLDLKRLFQSAVEGIIGPFTTIAISLSGGLDSAAVLAVAHQIAKRDGKDIVAITSRITSDQGLYAPELAAKIIQAVNPDIKHILVDPLNSPGKAIWSPAGPRLESMPASTVNTAFAAKREGCQAILVGSGADELLGSPRFMTAGFLRRHDFSNARSYVRDVLRGGIAAAIQEGFGSFLAPILPKRASARAYWALCWSDVLNNTAAPSVLSPRYRERVNEWSRDLLKKEFGKFLERNHTWSQADAWDAVFPHDAQPAVSEIPEYSPFLASSFGYAALHLPLTERYGHQYETHYFRRKGVICSLLPEQVLSSIHKEKQIYFQDFRRVNLGMSLQFTAAFDCGLLDPNAFDDTDLDPLVVRTCRAIDDWLRLAHPSRIAD